MAEVVGFLAAASQISGQIVSLTCKVKQLLDRVVNLPIRIKELSEELHYLGMALTDLESEIVPNVTGLGEDGSHDAVGISKSCAAACLALSELVKDLNERIESSKSFKRKAIVIRLVLHTRELDRLEARLKRSLDILKFCLQCANL